MKFSLPSDVYLASQLITRKILKASDSKEIQEFYNISRTKYINEDVILQIETPKNAKNNLTMATIKTILKDLSSLKEQNAIMNAVAEHCSSNFITLWQKVCDHLPKNLYVFTRKAIVFSLANSTNLARWKKVASNQCGLCKSNKQTQIHMLNNCPTAVQSGRYTWRHNSILFTICHCLFLLDRCGYTIYADILGYKNPSELFRNLRPDIVLLKRDSLVSIELTCCFETNLINSRNYKIDRYCNLEEDCNLNVKVKKLYVEVSSLGFLSKNIKELKTLCRQNADINVNRMLQKISEVAIRSTYLIYTKRNSEWTNPDILKFY